MFEARTPLCGSFVDWTHHIAENESFQFDTKSQNATPTHSARFFDFLQERVIMAIDVEMSSWRCHEATHPVSRRRSRSADELAYSSKSEMAVSFAHVHSRHGATETAAWRVLRMNLMRRAHART